MSEIVERVAKRISRMVPLGGGRWNEPHGHDFPNQYSATEQRLIRAIARAAIEAMREPTSEMIDLGWHLIRGNLRPDEIYPHMIDEALKVQP